MNFKKIAVLLPALLSLSFIFSSCNSVEIANESSELITETSSVTLIDEIEAEVLSTSSNTSEISQQAHSNGAQQLENLTSEGNERADKLMADLKNVDTNIIRFYNTTGNGLKRVGFQSFNEVAAKIQPDKSINDSNEIKNFISGLKLEEWIPKRFNLRSLPEVVIYISQELHINLETQHQGISWMSVNSADYVSVYFVVPNDVYENVLKCFG